MDSPLFRRFLIAPIIFVIIAKFISFFIHVLGVNDNIYVPTYDECVEIYKSYPIAIIDIVCSHKGSPSICIEICHKNPVSQTKINKLKEIGVHYLIEIDAEWILNKQNVHLN